MKCNKYYYKPKSIGPKQKLTLSVLLLLLPLASMDDHPSIKALQETWWLFSLLYLDLRHTGFKVREVLLTPVNHYTLTPGVYLSSSFLIQLHRHQR